MALPTTAFNPWQSGIDFANRLFGGMDDFELYEEDDAFVLSVEMPGFDAADIDVVWDDGVLNISADREDTERGRQRTYHRRFRFPKEIDDDAVTANYTNGVLEVHLPAEEGTLTGRQIELEA